MDRDKTLGVYPHLNNNQFQKKITLKKEFRFKYDDTLEPVAKKANILCKKTKDFELAPHQEFVRRFISIDNPYNGILLYHGLGSGKTCSAISITESLRMYSSLIPNFKKILIVASPNVQENFKLQLFDKNKLTNENGIWNLSGCVGNSLLEELYKFDINKLTKEELIFKIEKIIKDNYKFIGYIGLANFIKKLIENNDIKQLKYQFEGRIIVIDEIHNIRLQGENKESKLVATSLYDLVKIVKGIKLICLTGTPMYNDSKEIVFLLNLLNLNDKRPETKISSIFHSNGEIKDKEKLIHISNGYISYVRGENPYVFPYMITPKMYNDEHSLNLLDYPKYQFNAKNIVEPIKYLDLYKTKLSDFQDECYSYIIEQINDQYQEKGQMDHFEEMDSLKYDELMKPIQALTICYPNSINPREPYLFGKDGLSLSMKFTQSTKSNFEYKTGQLNGMFTYDQIGKYSSKIKNILDHILNSKGIVLIYSQYLSGGIIPIALALEELGFKRYGEEKKSLFKSGAKLNNKKLNVYSLPGFEDKKTNNLQACYSIISGDKGLSPKNSNNDEIEALTNNNLNGNRIKVVLISQAGTEGIDLKNIRQVHILEPWYNMNRIEQIIGRARRNCSHAQLDLKDRNFQLFMHVSQFSDTTIEPLDMFLYRNAEKKSIKIGKVTRLLKSVSIDCLLNIGQQKFSNAEEEVNIVTSEGLNMTYSIKDRPFSSLCDYMENCSYSCLNKLSSEEENINDSTYKYKFTKNDKIIDNIKELFLKRHVYKTKEIIHLLKKPNINILEIERALYDIVDNNIYVVDQFHKVGRIIKISNMYLFQPIESDNKRLLMYDRQVPITSKVTEIPIKLKYKKENKEKEIDTEELEEIEEMEDQLENISENEGENKEQKIEQKIEQKEAEVKNTQHRGGLKIIKEIERKYNLCISENTEINKDSNDLWYQYFHIAKEELKNRGFNIKENKLNHYAFVHICQELKINKEIELLNYLYSKEIDELSEFEKMLSQYYDELMIENNDVIGIFLIDIIDKIEPKEELYVKDPITNIWKKATYSEYKDLFGVEKEKINLQKLYLKDKFNKNVGFIGVHDNAFEFKEKNTLENKRSSKGAFVFQKQKAILLNFINDGILDETIFTKENTSRIDKLIIVIIAEMLMRYFDEKKEERYFLNKLEMCLLTASSINKKTTKK